MLVTKYSGEQVPFAKESLYNSLTRSGATEEEVNQVYEAIEGKLFDGITTRELYQLAFNILKSKKNSYAARYSLKQALRELGPDGFFFEKYIARLFRESGCQTITGQTVQGKAVTHEIDVVAVHGNEMYACECKFRNDIEAKISVTTPMYFLSRWKDISELNFQFFGKERQFTQGWLITNAYFTSDSIEFSKYYHINLLSWDYPKENSIKVRVDHAVLYPVTCLTSLTADQKQLLLKNQVILVKDILLKKDVLQILKLNPEDLQETLEEIRELLHYKVENL